MKTETQTQAEKNEAQAICERLTEIDQDIRAKALDDGRVAIWDSAASGWFAVDAEDAADLADRLDSEDADCDTYSLWCSETSSEQVEI